MKKGCEYCRDGKLTSNAIQRDALGPQAKAKIEHGSQYWYVVILSDYPYINSPYAYLTHIKYCPMCGADLSEVNAV